MPDWIPDWAIGQFLRPFILIPLFIAAVLLGRWILSRMKDGKLKRLLSRRVGP
jgi:hypothetical protein